VRSDQDEESGLDLHRAGVRGHSYRWKSVDQRFGRSHIRAELVEQRRTIDSDSIDDARRE